MAKTTDGYENAVTVKNLVAALHGEGYERLFSDYDMKALARVFEDEEMVFSCLALFENGLNISRAARKLYMHRNTLSYRLSRIKRLTGIDVTDFYGAIEFLTLYEAYAQRSKRSGTI